jgi:hypothetical protein
MRPSPLYMGIWLLVVLFWCGACTGAREGAEESYHYFDKTEVDLEYDRLEPSSSYRRPHGVRSYVYDATEVDLAIAPQQGAVPAAPSPSGKP